MAPVLTIALFHESSGWSLPERYVEQIRTAAGDRMEVRRVTSRHELLEALPETTHLIGLPLTEEQFRPHVERLEWIQLGHSSGDASDVLLMALEAGARVTSAATFRSPQVAEHAMALVLAMLRRIDAAVRAQEEHRWAAEELSGGAHSLNGMKLGVLSTDRIDDEIGRRARCFGAEVLALRRLDGSAPEAVDEVIDRGEIDSLIKRSDVVVVAMPRTPSSRNLVDTARVKMMKQTAYLVDVSRSGVVEQEALLRALRKRRIAGAGLDVFETEPLPKASPLWTMANVIVTPHICAATPDYWSRATVVFCENVRRILAGEPLLDELRPEWFGAGALV